MAYRFKNPVVAMAVFAGLLAAWPATAQDEEEVPEIRRYAVEIILFRYGSGVPVGNERFLPEPVDQTDDLNEDDIPEFSDLPTTPVAQRNATEVLEEIALPTLDVGVRITPRSELKLREIYDKLQLLDAYDPVMWTGWTQDAIDPAQSPHIPLRRLGNAPADIDGSLTLYVSRFLHLVVDLTLSERTAAVRDRPSFNSQAQLVHMRINEDRIMKNGDLRYYDHPKFGLLAKVTRIEKTPEAATEALTQP